MHVPEPDGYERRIGRYGPSLARAFISACSVAGVRSVLDVGCGTGALTEELARLLGPAAVAAADPEPEAVRICRGRVPGADVRIASAEALPFPDAAFDAAMAQLVISHMHDAEAGVREMRRVVRPQGIVATCVWDFAEGMRALRAFWDAAAAVDPAGASAHDQAATHAYGSATGLEALWRAAGLHDVCSGALQATTDYDDFDDLWDPLAIRDGAPGRYLATVAPREREAIRSELFERVGRPAGRFTLGARAWFVTGRR